MSAPAASIRLMYIGDDDTFDRAIERFAVAYADQNDADYAAFTEAAEKHRIEVERGVQRALACVPRRRG